MKKLLSFLIVSIFVLTLSACGDNVTDKNFFQNKANQQPQNSSGFDLTQSVPSGESSKQSNQTVVITREEALEIALKNAGLKQADIHDLDIELDRERGVNVWEVDFDYGNMEYSYDINAETGSVTRVENERDN